MTEKTTPDDNLMVQKGTVYINGKAGSFPALFVSRLQGKRLFFYHTEEEALLVKEELEFFSEQEVHLFPDYSDRFFDNDDESKRSAFLYHLTNDNNFLGLAPVQALFKPQAALQTLLASSRTVTFGDTVYQEDLIDYFEASGYSRAGIVRETGEYARRGSIIDVFPPLSQLPVRIEFLGDEILSIRHFQSSSQRSLDEMEQITIPPFRQGDLPSAPFTDFISDQAIVVHGGAGALFSLENEGFQNDLRAAITEKLSRCFTIDLSGIREDENDRVVHVQSNDDLHLLFEQNKTEIFKLLVERFRNDWTSFHYIYVYAHHEHQALRLKEIFENYGLDLPLLPSISLTGPERQWGIVTGPVRRGFRTGNMLVLTEEDIVGPKRRVAKRSWSGFDDFIYSFRDLHLGDYVVHIEHGIGVYRGISELTVAGYRRDFLLIEYQDADRLYVPVENLHLVQKYIGGDKGNPRVDRLGSSLWKTTKRKVKAQVEDMARDLLGLYAERQIQQGYRFSPEDELFREMESRFEYEETDGQLRVIGEVLEDMKSEKPMDRLVCGDVGFGKTEVAIRAAFKAVLDNKQVAILVPTTILAQQHYNNLAARFRDFPVQIGLMSRFKTKKEQQATAEGLRKGKIDIVIGTHRILQDDLALRDLGLLIIDEEHRFGVKHKEKLKGLRKNVDVLTMSATPIPRTLHMAMSGIKDLSIINSPPLDRLAVKTVVVKFSDDAIKKGITRELERGGQVFFVHNYIHNIGILYNHLKRLLPDTRIALAHGQMEGKVLEKIMIDFIGGKYDLLLSTNIIESGLDISNVNTIFINNAHRMGLADLYQLRGRVGRSTKQAYAYLLVPKDENLTHEASVRLKIIEELTELGSGFHVANYDLEIRGAGNLLGREQSGSVTLVGFEMYCTMLEEAVQSLKRLDQDRGPEEIVPEITIPLDASIPDTYMNDASQKLMAYKRLAKISDRDELNEIEEEFRDRFGEPPGPLTNLFAVIGLKVTLGGLKIKKIEHTGRDLVISITDQTPLNHEKLFTIVRKATAPIKLLPEGKIVVRTDKQGKELIDLTRNILMDLTGV